jgi:ABC-type glycerol-3-phosphate transport system substrate-binding protein
MFPKYFKRVFFLIVVFALALTACQQATEEPVAEEPAAAEEEAVAEEAEVEEEAPAEKPSGELVIWVQQANQDVWEQTVMPGFQEMYPDIELVFVNYGPEEVARQVVLAIQGGTGGPDLGVTQYRDHHQLVALQGVMDVTDLMQPYMDQFDPDILAYCETDGEVFCVPWDIGPTVTYYRRDIFEAAGLSSDPEDVSAMVATWDDYLDTCITIKDQTGLPCFPANKANSYGLMMIDMLWQQGIGFFDDEGNLLIDSPDYVAVLEKMGTFWDAEVTSDNLDWEDAWYADFSSTMDNTDTPPVATLVYPAWMGGFLKVWVAPDMAGQFGVAYMPAWEEGGMRASMGGGSAYFIPADSSNPEAAWAFIEYFALNAENQVAQYAYSDYFPTLLSTYDDPLMSEPDAYYGDQANRLIYADVAKHVPYAFIYDTQYYNVVSGALSVAVQNFATGTMTAEEALQEAAATVSLELGLP